MRNAPRENRSAPSKGQRLSAQGRAAATGGNDNRAPKDATKQMLSFPTQRSERLQILSRGMTQAVTALGYASLRGYGVVHPTVGELRVGQLPISVPDPLQPEREEDSYYIGEIKVTEVESLIPVTITDPNGEKELEFKVGYGITWGRTKPRRSP